MNRKKGLIYLLLILIMAASLRFYDLTKRGLFLPDETVYYRAACAGKASIENFFIKDGGNFLNALLPVTDSFAGKPNHILFGILGLFLFGISQYGPMMIIALFGVLTVWLAFAMGKEFYSERAGLIAAMLLAISGFHVYYSRSYMSHVDQTFFVVLAFFLYLRTYVKKTNGAGVMFLTGLILGLAFTAHTVTIFYVPVLIMFEIVICCFEKFVPFKRLPLRIFTFLLGFLVLPFVFLIMSIFGRNETAPLFTFIHKGYVGQVFFLDSGDAIQNGLLNNKNLGHWHLICLSGFYNGWFFTIFMIISSIAYFLKHVLKKKSFVALALFVLSAGMLIYWQFFASHERQFRLILATYPIFCVIMGVFIADMLNNRNLQRALIILLIIEGGYCSVKAVRQVRSHFNVIEDFLLANKAEKILTTSYYVATTSDLLMPKLNDAKIICVANWSEARGGANSRGKVYLMVSPDSWLNTDEFHFRSRPRLLVPDPFYFYFPSFYEMVKFTGRTDYLSHKDDIFAREVAVYDMKDLVSEKGL
ncbi:MAG: STT3 domain-containing protein [Candidatus Omnitrophica bacterium]|nr:STT3 domain-containing protein [Candidatus Omnitrophota bacterium]